MVKHQKKRQHRRTRKQRGGGGGSNGEFSIGHAFTTTGGVPISGPLSSYSNCGDQGLRPAPQVGGKRRRSQRGGGCPCGGVAPIQVGGGGGTGGYGFTLNNDLGKVYAATTTGPCPQVGGANPPPPAPSPYQIVSYPAGYGYTGASPVSTDSAHFLQPVGYDRTCQGGGARSRRGRKNRKGKKSRRAH
jgi:hypothetical protein